MNPVNSFINFIRGFGKKKVLVISNGKSNSISGKNFRTISKKKLSDVPVYAMDGGTSIIADGGSWV